MARDEATKSKLIKLLQQVSRGNSPRIGLVPSVEANVPAMVLVVALERADGKGVAAAFAGRADAVAVPAAEGAQLWPELSKSAGDKPLGLIVPGDASLPHDELKRYAELAPDFLIAPAATAPAALLSLKDIGKIITIDANYPPQLVRALGEMTIDAVIADSGKGDPDATLTVRDLLFCRQMVDFVHKPVLLTGDDRLAVEVLPLLREMGVEGLLQRQPASAKPDDVRERVSAFRQAIDELGRPIGRGREHGARDAILPRVTPTHTPVAEPDEEPDGE